MTNERTIPQAELRLGVTASTACVVAVTPDGVAYEITNARNFTCRPRAAMESVGVEGDLVLELPPVAFSGGPVVLDGTLGNLVADMEAHISNRCSFCGESKILVYAGNHGEGYENTWMCKRCQSLSASIHGGGRKQ